MQHGTVDTKWFKDRLADKGISLRKLATSLSINHTFLSKSFRGERRLQPQEAADVARILGVPFQDVIERAGVELPKEPGTAVTIVGTVNSVGEISNAVKGPRRAERPVRAPDDTAALRIAAPGSALDGWIAYYVPSVRIEPEAVGRLSVVGVAGDGRFLRVLTKGYERGKWALKGLTLGMEDVAEIGVEWAAPVIWLRG